jgi:bifunctional UDP-N-acetylglucosamine pyrophosphorylase/glucosamine-1-phosphate N-acetyltransferase
MNKTILHIIVLAAGHGTRMKSNLPKILHPLGGRPVVHHVLDLAHQMNPKEIIVVVSPALKEISLPFSSRIVVQHPAQGTGDAVKQALPLITPEGYVLVLYGDTPLIQKETLEKMVSLSKTQPEIAIILLGMRPENPYGYGRLLLNDAGGLEENIEEKDLSLAQKDISLCNAGIMLVRADLLEGLLSGLTSDNAAKEYYLPDIIKRARKQGLPCAVVEGATAEFMGVNTQKDLAKAEEALQERWRDQAMMLGATLKDPKSVYFSYDTKVSADVTIHPSVVFGPGVVVETGAEIFPFCHISEAHLGPSTKVGPFAHLRGGVDLQNNAEIGNFVEIKKSTFSAYAKAKHLSYIGDAEIGSNANIGAGTITCNYDGFLKSKTSIGEGAFIGSNSALVAPLSIGDYAIVAAGSVVTKDVESQALVIARSEQTSVPKGAETFRANRQKKKDTL